MHWRRLLIGLLVFGYVVAVEVGLVSTFLALSTHHAVAKKSGGGENSGKGNSGNNGNAGGNSGSNGNAGGNSGSNGNAGGNSGNAGSNGNAGGNTGTPGNSAFGQAQGATPPGKLKETGSGTAATGTASAQTTDVGSTATAGSPAAAGGGERAISGEIAVANAGPGLAAYAAANGFKIISEQTFGTLGLSVARLAPPARLSLAAARDALQSAFPGASVDYNHVLTPASSFTVTTSDQARQEISWRPDLGGCGVATAPLGMLDTLADLSQATLAGAAIEQRSFLDDPSLQAADPTHASVIAAILVGNDSLGLLPDRRLAIAGIFTVDQDGQPIASVSSFIAGLDWLVGSGVRTINTSLNGPYNKLMELAVKAAAQQGGRMVAAVGNNGLSAAPQYPAAFPDVIGVTAIDAERQPYSMANRGDFVSLAAPGVDLWVPYSGQGSNGIVVSGTSFATPFVAAALAANGNDADALMHAAIDLGETGRDPVYGHGLVQATSVCEVAAQ